MSNTGKCEFLSKNDHPEVTFKYYYTMKVYEIITVQFCVVFVRYKYFIVNYNRPSQFIYAKMAEIIDGN